MVVALSPITIEVISQIVGNFSATGAVTLGMSWAGLRRLLLRLPSRGQDLRGGDCPARSFWKTLCSPCWWAGAVGHLNSLHKNKLEAGRGPLIDHKSGAHDSVCNYSPKSRILDCGSRIPVPGTQYPLECGEVVFAAVINFHEFSFSSLLWSPW